MRHIGYSPHRKWRKEGHYLHFVLFPHFSTVWNLMSPRNALYTVLCVWYCGHSIWVFIHKHGIWFNQSWGKHKLITLTPKWIWSEMCGQIYVPFTLVACIYHLYYWDSTAVPWHFNGAFNIPFRWICKSSEMFLNVVLSFGLCPFRVLAQIPATVCVQRILCSTTRHWSYCSDMSSVCVAHAGPD